MMTWYNKSLLFIICDGIAILTINQLTGTLPDSLGNLSKLKIFEITRNKVRMPSFISSLNPFLIILCSLRERFQYHGST